MRAILFGLAVILTPQAKGEWTPISESVTSKVKPGWPGLTGGVAADRTTGEVFMVVCDQGLWKSADKGATWSIGTAPVDAVAGPFWGKDENHMVVVGKEGFIETTDGGKSWKTAAPLPSGFGVSLVGSNYAWDPKSNIFYASNMGKPTYKFER